MKKIFLMLFVITTVTCFGQRKIKIHEEREKIANGTNNALVATIYESTPDAIEKSWKQLMKGYDAKVSNKKEIFADDALIKDMSVNTCDIYAFTRKINDDETELVVAVDLGGAYLSSSEHSSKYKIMEKILKDFAVEASSDAIKEKLKSSQKVLDVLTKDNDNLIRDKEHLEKQIEDYKQKIADNEKSIEKNTSQQADKQKEIENQKTIIQEIEKRLKSVE